VRRLARAAAVALVRRCRSPRATAAPRRALPPAARSVRALPALSDSARARLVLSLSEQGGFFDTDNLISNERSYLHVIGAPAAHARRRVPGGRAGPELLLPGGRAARGRVHHRHPARQPAPAPAAQVALRPLVERAEYLARLHGRALPDNPRSWDRRPLEDILKRVESLPVDSRRGARERRAVDSLVRALPLPITDQDRATIERFHRTFIENGTALRFQTFGRAPRPYYPTYRQLLLETDAAGRPASFLVDEEDFRWVKELERRNLVIPVVGDLAGAHAVRAIGGWLERQGRAWPSTTRRTSRTTSGRTGSTRRSWTTCARCRGRGAA
jgi:hypothetical protein